MQKVNLIWFLNCFREQFEEVSPTDKKRPTTPAPTHENLEDQRLKKSFKLKNLGNFNSRYSRNSITSFYCFRPVEEFYLLDESKVWSRIGKKYRGLAQTEKQTSIWTFQNKEGLPWTTQEDYFRESTVWFIKRLDQKLSFLN